MKLTIKGEETLIVEGEINEIAALVLSLRGRLENRYVNITADNTKACAETPNHGRLDVAATNPCYYPAQ